MVIWLYFIQIQNTGFIRAVFFLSADRPLQMRWVEKPVHFIWIVVVGAWPLRWLFRPLCSACQVNTGVLLHQNIVVKTLWIFWKRTVTMNSGKEVHLWGVLHIFKRKRYSIGQFLSTTRCLKMFLVSLHPPPHCKIKPTNQQGWIEEAVRTPKDEIFPSLSQCRFGVKKGFGIFVYFVHNCSYRNFSR